MKRPPDFSTTVDLDFVDVTITAEELIDAGWVYQGSDDNEVYEAQTLMDTVRRWHDDHHQDPWIFCRHELCNEVRR